MRWKKITIICVCLFCVVVFLIGYEKPWLWSIERRLRGTRMDIAHQVRQHQGPGVRYPGSLVQQMQIRSANILAGLCVVTSLGMEYPTICDASVLSLDKGVDKGAMLVVYWLQDQPTPEMVRLVWEDGRTRDFPIHAAQIEANQKIAKHSVLYDATLFFTQGSAKDAELEANAATSVALVKAGKEISCRWPLARVDRIPAGGNADRNSAEKPTGKASSKESLE